MAVQKYPSPAQGSQTFSKSSLSQQHAFNFPACTAAHAYITIRGRAHAYLISDLVRLATYFYVNSLVAFCWECRIPAFYLFVGHCCRATRRVILKKYFQLVSVCSRSYCVPVLTVSNRLSATSALLLSKMQAKTLRVALQ